MAELPLHFEMSAQKRCTQLGNELLGRICLRSEAIPHVALEARLVAAPVDELMQLRRIVVLGERKIARIV